MSKSESISTTSEEEMDQESFGDPLIWPQDDPRPSNNEISQLQPKFEKKASLCRLCAGFAENPFYIFSETGQSMKISDKINTCLSVKVRKTDPLPKQLCTACLEKVNWCNEFDIQCIKAEEALLSMLKEKQTSIGPDQVINEIICDEKSCPLCIQGKMSTNQKTIDPQNLYDSDIVLDSSDEERTFQDLLIDQECISKSAVTLQCLGNTDKYLKCEACKNLYYTKNMLDEHKCKPLLQITCKLYTCSFCSTTFSFEEQLNFHLSLHGAKKPLFCEICKLSFVKEIKFFFHHKRYHCEEKTASCLQCGKLFQAQEELKSHACVDGKTRTHICVVCSKGFSDGYTLKRHIVTHLPEKPYKCSQCSKSFTQKSRLNKHIATHETVVESTQLLWKCAECKKVFGSSEECDKHEKSHDKSTDLVMEKVQASKIYHCEFCNSFFLEKESLKIHQNQHFVEKPYKCEDCELVHKSFTEAVLDWKQHQRAFKVQILFPCMICSKEMKELSLLYKHCHKRLHYLPRSTESGGEKFACELCGLVLPNVEDLQNHERSQCSKFNCDVCGSCLPSANSLNAHKRRHSGLRPYVCNICGKSYTQSSHMWTHKRFHMGVKPYACEYCGQRFTIKPDLADHRRKKHTRERPFKCDVCDKAFLTGSVFYQHRLIHRGDRRYKCNFCEKAFTRTEALNNHVKIHTGEKPHVCDVCGRCFRQKGDMRKHRRTQHLEIAKES